MVSSQNETKLLQTTSCCKTCRKLSLHELPYNIVTAGVYIFSSEERSEPAPFAFFSICTSEKFHKWKLRPQNTKKILQILQNSCWTQQQPVYNSFMSAIPLYAKPTEIFLFRFAACWEKTACMISVWYLGFQKQLILRLKLIFHTKFITTLTPLWFLFNM